LTNTDGGSRAAKRICSTKRDDRKLHFCHEQFYKVPTLFRTFDETRIVSVDIIARCASSIMLCRDEAERTSNPDKRALLRTCEHMFMQCKQDQENFKLKMIRDFTRNYDREFGERRCNCGAS
jgi:hypothetical protein